MLYGMVRKENQVNKKIKTNRRLDLHQSNWGYNKQAKWFEEQIWGLK